VSSETTLNAVWAGIGLVAMCLFAWIEIRRRPNSDWKARGVRFFAMAFAMLCLFPCISESDDLLSLQNLQFTAETRGELETSVPQPQDDASSNLAHYFEALQTIRLALMLAMVLMLTFLAAIGASPVAECERRLAAVPSRAPPAASLSTI